MIRIDENTYIDDTLVTCAEYQLFIDEMREQGQYYQPDHWTSYQFPAGQARDPILGVRFWDAVDFTDWLTKREEGEWKFRLLTIEEVKQCPLEILYDQPRAYWALGKKDRYGYLIVVHNTDNTNNLNLNLARVLERDPQLANIIERSFEKFQDREISVSIALEDALTEDRELDLGHYGMNNNRNLENDLNTSIALALGKARDLIEERAFTIDIKFYADLVILQERIAGRSPAFEGIRLVKERKP
jgi:hypothetical protein